MAVVLAPVGDARPQFFTDAGAVLNGGKIYFYAAGTSTPQNTYTDSTGATANANPVVLDADGRAASGIWFTQGLSYKIVAKDSSDNTLWTEDNVDGINDVSATQDEWVASGITPTYVSASSFTMSGDQTTAFHVGRRLKATISGGTSYSTITGSSFAAATTTVTVDTTGSNVLDAGLSATSYGLLSAANFSQSIGMDAVARQSADIASAATLNLDAAGGDLVDVTGTTTVTAITLARGKVRVVRFTGSLLLTHGASLVLPDSANIQTAAGDYGVFRGYASGVVRCLGFQRLQRHGADVASAATVNLDTATGDLIDVTGTTTITAITLAEGRECTVRFTGALTLTHGASLVLPKSANILTAAGDYAIFRGYSGGVVRCVAYQALAGGVFGTTQTITHSGTLQLNGSLQMGNTNVVGWGDLSVGITGDGSAETLAFKCNNTDYINITSGGITALRFNATQVDSANANTLDDYEEGTWTPSLGGNTTYTGQTGTYTKIGRLVHVDMNLAVNTLGTGSTTTVSGLPFTAGAIASYAVSRMASLAANVVFLAGITTAGGTTITFDSLAAAAASTTTSTAIWGSGTQVVLGGAFSV